MKKYTGIIRFAIVTLVLCTAVLALTSCSSSSSSSSDSYSNDYGSPGTQCAHPGCTRSVASTGDTNCCTTHSNRCGGCGKYIDEEASYCFNCMFGG